MTEEQFKTLNDKLDKMTGYVNRRIQWEEQVTSTGIQLQGVTKATRSGVLLGLTALPGPQGILVLWIVKQDDGTLKPVQGEVKVLDP